MNESKRTGGSESKSKARRDVLRGTLDLLILKTVAYSPMHGWAITQRIHQTSDGLLEVNQGSLYPALQRLELRALIRGEWQQSETQRRAKVYSLTRTGKRVLGEETKGWREYVAAVETILAT